MWMEWKVARRVIVVAWLLPLLCLVPAWLVPWNHVHMRDNISAYRDIVSLLISGCIMIAGATVATSISAIALVLARNPPIDIVAQR